MGSFKRAVACVLSGALLSGQMNHAVAAPLPTNVAAMKSVVETLDTPVDYRGWAWGWGSGAGLFAGAIIGGAITSSTYGYYGWYGWPSYDGYPYRSYGNYYSRANSYPYAPDYGYGPHCYYSHHRRHYGCYYNYW